MPVRGWKEVIAEGPGTVVRTTGITTPIDYVDMDGTYKLRSEYPELFQFALESGNIVEDANWSANKYS